MLVDTREALAKMGIHILGIGNPFFDRIAHVKSLPEDLKKGDTHLVFEKKIADQFWEKAYGVNPYSWSLGGSCTNVIKVFSQLLSGLGLRSSCSLHGMAGKDRKIELEESLKKFNVNPILIEGTKDNGIVNCFVTPDSQRTMQAFFGAALEFSPKNISSEAFTHVSHVHLEGYLAYFPGVLERSIELAKKSGATISLDLSSTDVITNFKDKMKECSAKVDMIFGNLQEMNIFTECKDVSEIIKKFNSNQMVVITTGSQGCCVKPVEKSFEESKALKFDALKVEAEKIIDTTGAGDFFIAGFLAGWLSKKDMKTSIKIANLAASFVIQQDGADLLPEKWDELKKQMMSYR